MSGENLELAREYIETFNAHGLDGVEEMWHPEIELLDPPQLPDGDRYSGRAALRRQVESYLSMGWDGQFRSPEYVDGEKEVVVTWRGQGGPRGVQIDLAVSQVFLFEDGKIRRIRQFLSRAEALEAAGLSE